MSRCSRARGGSGGCTPRAAPPGMPRANSGAASFGPSGPRSGYPRGFFIAKGTSASTAAIASSFGMNDSVISLICVAAWKMPTSRPTAAFPTVPAMMLAAGGVPDLGLVAVVLVGGALAAGAANALNCYIDRDIDQV